MASRPARYGGHARTPLKGVKMFRQMRSCICKSSASSAAFPTAPASEETITQLWLDDTKHDLSPGESIKQSAAIFVLPGVASEEECKLLVDVATQRAHELQSSSFSTGLDPSGRTRLPSIAAAKRAFVRQIPCADPLPTHADATAETILKRVLSAIDLQLPSVAQTLFPSAESNLAAAYEANQLEFSAREPAVSDRQ